MKMLTILAATLAVTSAGRIYNNQQPEGFYQPYQLQQQHVIASQSQGLVGHGQSLGVQSQAFIGQHGQSQLHSTQPQSFAHDAAQGQNYLDQQENQRPSGEKSARILAYDSESDGHNYQYAYETENGIKAQEVGIAQGKGIQAQGAYSYVGDDGQTYTVNYIADENGFRAQGAHLPTPPPIPEAIAKSIEQTSREEANGVFDDGKYNPQEHEQSYQQQYDSGAYQPSQTAYHIGQNAHQANRNAYQTNQNAHQTNQNAYQINQNAHPVNPIAYQIIRPQHQFLPSHSGIQVTERRSQNLGQRYQTGQAYQNIGHQSAYLNPGQQNAYQSAGHDFQTSGSNKNNFVLMVAPSPNAVNYY